MNHILQIPLSIQDNPDGWRWLYTNHENYTTKSGYHVARELKFGRLEPCYISAEDWKSFWKLDVPEKIKVFGWRTITNCLPVRARLRMKGVDIEEECPLCDDAMESAKHLLCDCSISRAVWSCAMLENQVRGGEGKNFAELISVLLQQGPKPVVELFLTTCWFIWSGRNDVIWKGARFDASQIAENSFRYLEEIEKIKSASKQEKPNTLAMSGWMPPPRGNVKHNVDGAIFVDSGRSGDEEGMVLRAFNKEF